MSGATRAQARTFSQTAWTTAQTCATPDTAVLDAVPPKHDAWLVLAPAETWAHPEAPGLIAAAAAARPDVELFYADAAVLRPGERPALLLKPSFDRTQLMAQDYLGPFLAVRGSAFHALGGLRADAGTARLYDLALRAMAKGRRIDRIAEVLTAAPASDVAASVGDRRRILRNALAASGEPLEVVAGRTPASLGATLSSRVATCGRPAGPGEPFNFAAKMNHLWRLADTEHLVLLNDDVEATDPAWLRALMTFAVMGDVGAVGARLLFPDGRLQHAGVIGGLFGLCAHPWLGQPADRATYQDWALVQREWSIVTGAVLATRRTALERVNGFDPAFSLDFNDVDLCLKMRLQGLRVVYTPYAELIHHEKASRGEHPTIASEMAIFLRRWRELLDDDPSYHPAMSRNSFEPAPIPPAGAWYERL